MHPISRMPYSSSSSPPLRPYVTRKATGDLLVSKRPDFLISFCISGNILGMKGAIKDLLVSK